MTRAALAGGVVALALAVPAAATAGTVTLGKGLPPWKLGQRFADSRGRLYLVDVATSRAGDRSADGFVVAVSTRGAVRHQHPGVAVSYAQRPLALGASSLTVIHRTGKETFDELVYWFDAQGTLTALEALAGGC
jgi:hypothetical protein